VRRGTACLQKRWILGCPKKHPFFPLIGMKFNALSPFHNGHLKHEILLDAHRILMRINPALHAGLGNSRKFCWKPLRSFIAP
jgi:hypothetical protein